MTTAHIPTLTSIVDQLRNPITMRKYGKLSVTKYRNAGAMLQTSAGAAPKRRRLEMHDDSTPSVPYGYCHCGCGRLTSIATQSDTKRGYVKGEPKRFVTGHRLPDVSTPQFSPQHNAFVVPLSGNRLLGLFALIDEEDVEVVSGYRWSPQRTQTGRTIYAGAQSTTHSGQGRRHILMHRLILGLDDGVQCDHENHNGLDNRRQNLRPADNSQNAANRPHVARGSSPYRGVWWNKRRMRWYVTVRFQDQQIHVGTFEDETAAALAYDRKARELFGEFALVNFPEGGVL